MTHAKKFSLTLFLAGAAVFGQQAGTTIPESWAQLPRTAIPLQARVTGWTKGPAAPGQDQAGYLLVDQARVKVEVPPGEKIKVQLLSSASSKAALLMPAEAWWKPRLRFSQEGAFKNRGGAPRWTAVVLGERPGMTYDSPDLNSNIAYLNGGRSGHAAAARTTAGKGAAEAFTAKERADVLQSEAPARVRCTRSWDIEAWRIARTKTAPALEGLSELAPQALTPSFVPPLEGPQGPAEVTLIVDAQGRPWAVHPGAGDPGQVAKLADWAWQLAFEPGKGLPATGAVKVPLRVNRPL